jgi:hypothetical protein
LYTREFLFRLPWALSEGGGLSGFNCTHKDKTYIDFKLKWPALFEEVAGNTFSPYFASLKGEKAYEINTFSRPPYSFKFFTRLTDFHATWNERYATGDHPNAILRIS